MSASVDTTKWLPGTRYFIRVTDDDHTGWLYIITLLSLCYMMIVFVIRFVVKFGMYGNDDWALLVSTLLASGQHIALLNGISVGMGKSTALLSTTQIDEIERYIVSQAFIFVLSHCASKISTALLTERLFSNGRKRNNYLSWMSLVVSVVYGIWAVITLSAGCASPGFPLKSDNECNNRYLRWQLLTAIDVFSEFVLVAVPAILILDIQIKRNAKLLVVAVFSVRLPDIAFSLLSLYSIPPSITSSTDLGLAVVMPIIWSQTELLWSIVAASVPCLKAFLRPFDKIDEDTWRSNNKLYASHRSGGGLRSWEDPKDGSVPLEEIKTHARGLVLSKGKALGSKRLSTRPDNVRHDVVIASANSGFASEDERRHSWGSQERIIKKERQWEVRRESGPRDPYLIP